MTDSPGVYASTACLENTDYLATLDAYDWAGIERVELGYCPDDDVDVGAVLDRYAFECVAHNYCLPRAEEFVVNLASPSRSIRDRSVRYVCDAIEFCHARGIPAYSFHSGFLVDPGPSWQFPTDDLPPYDERFEAFVDSLERVVAFVTDYDVDLTIENNVATADHVSDGTPVVMFARPAEFDRLYDRIDPSEVGVLLDTGHLNVSATTLGYDPADFLDAVGEYVSTLHVHWNDGREDSHEPSEDGDYSVEILRRFPECSVTTEARFTDVGDLSRHLAWLDGVA